MKHKYLLTSFFFTLSFLNLQAQTRKAQYTQYMYNQMSFNPAYAGSQDKTIIFGQYRTQWVGLDGAPKTTSFSVNSPVSERGQGLGISFENDQIGPTITNTAEINYSYGIELKNYVMLFFGMKIGGTNFEIDYSRLDIKDSENDMFGKRTQFSPNIGTGVFIQSDTWYGGVSVPRILETTFYNDEKNTIASENMTIYLHGGYIFDLNPNLLFKPSMLVKFLKDEPISVDVSASFLINEKFTVGTAYRLNSSVSALLGFQISKGTNIGYAYDYETTSIGNYTAGSHEFFIKFNLEPIAKTIIGRNCWCY